jgi:hypothetical protein
MATVVAADAAVATADAATEATAVTAVAVATETGVATKGVGATKGVRSGTQWHAINRDRVPYVEYLCFFLTNSFPT